MSDNSPKFSVLIIGCGAIAGGYDKHDKAGKNILTHAKAFNNHDGFDLVACYDQDYDATQEFANMWAVDQAHDNIDVALAENKYDIISICTPTSTHENYLCLLAEYKIKLVFCEKPITDNLISAREIVRLYGSNLSVNYLRRFDPDIIQLAQDIMAGKYGKILSGNAEYNKGLYNNGSHMIDLLHLLIGPVTVNAAQNVIYDFWPDDPTISARLMTGEGAEIELVGSDVRKGMVFDLSLNFEKAQVILTDFSHELIIRREGGAEQKVTTGLDKAMLYGVSNIYDHLTVGRELLSTAENAVLALEICEKIQKLSILP